MGAVLEVPYCGNVAKWQCGDMCPSIPKSRKSNLRGQKITDSSIVYYGSLKLGDFVLKIAPNRRRKFGTWRKMLYLCIVIRKTQQTINLNP